MKLLYLKTTLGIIASVFLTFAIIRFTAIERVHVREKIVVRKIFGSGLHWVIQDLRKRPLPEIHQWLQKNLRYFSISISISSSPPKVKKIFYTLHGHKEEIWIEDYPRHFLLWIALSDSKYLKIGPITPPLPPDFLMWLFLLCFGIFTFLLIVFFLSPIERRIRRLIRATMALKEQRWETRVPEDTKDAFGQLANSFNQMAAQITQLFKEREELMQAVSHELGTPLARMRFGLEFLSSAPPEEHERHLHSLREELDELDQLSTELVDWLGAGERIRQRKRHDLVPTLDLLVEEIEDELPQEKRIVLRCEETLFAKVELRQFQRAIENLLRNAVRHAQSNIEVCAYQQTSWIYVEVSDDGDGVSEENRKIIFDPFVSFATSTKTHRSGVGLGLSIVQRILERHNGTCKLFQAVPQGARFVTRWPLV